MLGLISRAWPAGEGGAVVVAVRLTDQDNWALRLLNQSVVFNCSGRRHSSDQHQLVLQVRLAQNSSAQIAINE